MTPTKQTSRSLLNNDQGFTLTETMIALLVFTIGALAVVTMTISALDGFSRARISSTEVSRTATNIETLKEVGYGSQIAFSGKGASMAPKGSDGAVVTYRDTPDAIVAETSLIVMDNSKMKGGGTGGIYELYYVKPLIEK